MTGGFYIEGKKEKIDISGILEAVTDLDAKVRSLATPVDFWSLSIDVIDLPAVATNVNLPDVTVGELPVGISLVRVVAILKVRAIENTSAAGLNAIDGIQAIRVKKSTGVWGVDDIVAITLPDNLWTVAASTREAGDLVVGSNDIKSKVDGQGIYNFRFENARVDLDYLRLNDVMVGLRFYLGAQ